MLFLAFASAFILGNVWEIYEFGMDLIADKTDQYDTLDTLSDLFLDVLGGTLAAVVFISGGNYKKDSYGCFVNEEKRMVRVGVSSEEPVERSFGMEVLGHSADDINMEFISSLLSCIHSMCTFWNSVSWKF